MAAPPARSVPLTRPRVQPDGARPVQDRVGRVGFRRPPDRPRPSKPPISREPETRERVRRRTTEDPWPVAPGRPADGRPLAFRARPARTTGRVTARRWPAGGRRSPRGARGTARAHRPRRERRAPRRPPRGSASGPPTTSPSRGTRKACPARPGQGKLPGSRSRARRATSGERPRAPPRLLSPPPAADRAGGTRRRGAPGPTGVLVRPHRCRRPVRHPADGDPLRQLRAPHPTPPTPSS